MVTLIPRGATSPANSTVKRSTTNRPRKSWCAHRVVSKPTLSDRIFRVLYRPCRNEPKRGLQIWIKIDAGMNSGLRLQGDVALLTGTVKRLGRHVASDHRKWTQLNRKVTTPAACFNVWSFGERKRTETRESCLHSTSRAAMTCEPRNESTSNLTRDFQELRYAVDGNQLVHREKRDKVGLLPNGRSNFATWGSLHDRSG